MTISYQVAAKTDVGCVRSNNEDSFGYDERYGIHVVCDGMGGHEAGEEASKLAVQKVLEYFRNAGEQRQYGPPELRVDGASPRGNALASAIHLANQAVYAAGAVRGGERRMGSTIAAVVTQDGFFSTGHVGDSRIYLIRNHQIEQLTQDHSLVMEQVRRGLLTKEEAEHSQLHNIIVRALGSEESVAPDVDDHASQPADAMLLCSDGLTRHLVDDRLLEIVEQSPNPAHACEQLVQAARAEGGEDNITCMLIRASNRPWYRGKLPGAAAGGKPEWRSSF